MSKLNEIFVLSTRLIRLIRLIRLPEVNSPRMRHRACTSVDYVSRDVFLQLSLPSGFSPGGLEKMFYIWITIRCSFAEIIYFIQSTKYMAFAFAQK